MNDEKKVPHVVDKRLVYSHRNIQRWALFATNPWVKSRVLYRYGLDGEVIDRCEIGSWEIGGRSRTLGVEEGAILNIIEALHDRLRPKDGVLLIGTSDFYDFMTDVASISDPGKRKGRHSIERRNYLHDRLKTLMAVSIVWDNWKEKDGTGGAQRFNLLDAFEISGLTPNGKRGQIKIVINPIYAAGLRARHTAPILVEVANSFKTSTGWVLYRYIDKVMAKRLDWEMRLDDLAKRLAMNERKDELLFKVRAAVAEMQNKDLTSGRITLCKLEKRSDGLWWLVVHRGRRVTVKSTAYTGDPKAIQAQTKFDDYLARYETLDPIDRAAIDQEVDKRLSANRWGTPHSPGYALLKKGYIVEAMERYFMTNIDRASSEFCAPSVPEPLVLREGPCLSPYRGAAEIRHETMAFLGLPFPPLLPYRKAT